MYFEHACAMCVHSTFAFDNILPFLLSEIFMVSPHLSMKLRRTRYGTFFSFQTQDLRGLPVHARSASPLYPAPIYMFIFRPDINFHHHHSLELFIFRQQGAAWSELWYVNCCDPLQVSQRPHTGHMVWCLERRRWKGFSQFGRNLCTRVFMEAKFDNNVSELEVIQVLI